MLLGRLGLHSSVSVARPLHIKKARDRDSDRAQSRSGQKVVIARNARDKNSVVCNHRALRNGSSVASFVRSRRASHDISHSLELIFIFRNLLSYFFNLARQKKFFVKQMN